MIASFVFVAAVSASITVWVLAQRPGEARGPRYYATLTLEHVALAAQCAALLTFLGRISALMPALAGAAGFVFFVADALMYRNAGLRMQWSLLTAIGELPAFAARTAWRRVLVALLGGSVVCGFVAQKFAQPSPSAGWPCIALCAAAGLVACVMTEPLRRGLPMVAAFDWNIRVINRQAAAVVGFFGAGAASNAAPVDAANRAQQNPAAVPRTLSPQHEVATSPNPTRPLMRQSAGFNGSKHFDVRIEAGEKPHVVIVFMESVRAADVGILGAKHGPKSLTPCFDALAAEGILWRDFYGNGTITALAMSATLYGVPPPFLQRAPTDSAPEATMLGMPHIFAEQGYLPAFFCDGPLDWENKRQFLLHNGFPLFYAAPSIKSAYPEAPNSVWHFQDEYLMRFHAQWLAKQDARGLPTFSSILTVSNHYPWQAPAHAPAIDVPLDKNSLQYRYLHCTAYTDHCLGQYIADLRQRGLDRKTIFIIMGDHAQQVNNPNDVWWSGRSTTDGVRVPCLLYAPGRVSPKVIDEVASQTDILPTLLDIFDWKVAHHAVGTSLRRQCAARTALTVQPWAPGMVTTRFSTYRHAYALEARRGALYAADTDPESLHDIADKHPDIAAERLNEAERMRAFMDILYAEDRIATPPGTAYLQGRLLLNAPDNFPSNIQACRERLRRLQTMGAKRTPSDATETTLLLLALNTHGLNDDERLDFAQLLLARTHIATVGEMTDAEEARLAALDDKVSYPDAMPAWERNMIESMRYLAHDKPFPFFRTARPG